MLRIQLKSRITVKILVLHRPRVSYICFSLQGEFHWFKAESLVICPLRLELSDVQVDSLLPERQSGGVLGMVAANSSIEST